MYTDMLVVVIVVLTACIATSNSVYLLLSQYTPFDDLSPWHARRSLYSIRMECPCAQHVHVLIVVRAIVAGTQLQ